MESHEFSPTTYHRDWMLMYLGFLLGEKLHDSISVEFTVVSIRVMNSWRESEALREMVSHHLDFRQGFLGN